ncbi:MAG: potassium channel protein [Thermostichales cyanobacterium BF4_bins_65]
MTGSVRNILRGALCFAITVVVAISGYLVSGWPFLDAVYQVVITVFGVGFGEVRPIITPAMRVFTMIVIVAGSTSAVYMVSGIVQLLTEGEIKRALEKHQMTRTIADLNQHVILCGFGDMGQLLAQQLQAAHHPLVVVDTHPDRISQIESLGIPCYQGNATDESVLKAVGIHKAKVLATVLDDDATNVFLTLTARELNPNLIILARGELPGTEKKLRLAGANHVVLPATIGALRMAQLITHPATLDFLDRNDGARTVNEILIQVGLHMDELAIDPGCPLLGQTLRQISAQGKGSFIVVAVRAANGTVVTEPDPEQRLTLGDTLIVVGRKGDLPSFARRFNLKRQFRYRGSQA